MTADGETRFWAGFILEAYPFTTFPPGARVLDVGCGAVGIEPSQVAARRCRAKGLTVLSATAEHIPLTDGWADGVICKVVVPYAEEKSAIAECGRVLKPGGRMEACYHGVGYYLRWVLLGPSARLRLYGLRSILNSWLYALLGAAATGAARQYSVPVFRPPLAVLRGERTGSGARDRLSNFPRHAGIHLSPPAQRGSRYRDRRCVDGTGVCER